jgi:predicted dehydrogenase
MAPSELSRRVFLGSVAGGLTAMTAFNWRVLAQQRPNDQIVLGMIGVGGQGTSRLRQFLAQPDVRIGAICDVDRAHVDRAVAEVEKAGGHKPKTFGDFRRVLEDPEIDAVAIVTPDHWHALATVRAFEAGKDVFVEKPLSYSVAEGRMMADDSLKYKRVTQMGNHIHNDLPNYRRVVELVQSGKLGRITRVHCWRTGGGGGGGGRAGGAGRGGAVPAPPPAVPETLDYDFGLGPAPNRPYHPLRSHGSFRRWWDYSGGTFIDFWAHIFDVATWALDLKAPRAVTSVGGRYFLQDETETPDTVEAVLEYPDMLAMFSLRPTPLPGFEHLGDIGCLFQGSEAWLATNYSTNEVWVKGKKVEDFPRPAPTIPDSPGHLREFLDAIKSRNLETTCNVRYGHRVTKPGLLSNISYRTGRRIQWDDETERVIDDKDATRYLSRRFRKDYKL